MAAADLFGERPRVPRRTMMHVIDAGEFPDGKAVVHFVCSRCGFDQGWTYQTEPLAQAKRGRMCPQCNISSGATNG